jgi:CDP-diacylglycerol--glycerol-3-phosphate 3-phosphatidyltransferase
MSLSLFALLNLALILGAGLGGMRLYWGRYGSATEVKGSRMLSARVRAWYFSNLEPFADWFVRARVPPIAITYAQVVGATACALAYADGLIFNAGWLVLFSGTLDILDGKVARRGSGDSKRGAFLDSVVDRYAEFISYTGLMVFYGGGWHVWMVLFAMLGGMMVSYTRARAEGLGLPCEIGWLQRPERFVLLGFGSIFSSITAQALGGGQALLTATIILLAVLSNITAAQRIIYVSRQLGTTHA